MRRFRERGAQFGESIRVQRVSATVLKIRQSDIYRSGLSETRRINIRLTFKHRKPHNVDNLAVDMPDSD